MLINWMIKRERESVGGFVFFIRDERCLGYFGVCDGSFFGEHFEDFDAFVQCGHVAAEIENDDSGD